jgi:peptidoglycan LD-endopeptidase CwlK
MFNQNSIKKLGQTTYNLQKVVNEAIKDSPYRFEITCGHRTIDKQKKFYAKGRTEPGPIITNCDGVVKLSKHNYLPARAFDFVVFDENNQITWDVEYYKKVGEHILTTAKKLNIKIKWPIRLNKKTYDWPHVEE